MLHGNSEKNGNKKERGIGTMKPKTFYLSKEFESPREEMQVSLGKIQEQLTQESHHTWLSRHVIEDISDAINLSQQQQSKATEDFNQTLAQKRQERSS
jgi:hypothetical protein